MGNYLNGLGATISDQLVPSSHSRGTHCTYSNNIMNQLEGFSKDLEIRIASKCLEKAESL